MLYSNCTMAGIKISSNFKIYDHFCFVTRYLLQEAVYSCTCLGGNILTREKELLQRIKRGDNSCWEELVSMYYDDILRYCIYHSPDQDTARDAVQETFLKVIRHFPKYQDQGKFRGFLYKVAANTCTDLWRKRREVQLPEDMEYLETGYAGSEAQVNFQHMVHNLPEELKEIVYLKFAQELTFREIAMAVELPVRTVQSRLRRALKLIRREMEGEV